MKGLIVDLFAGGGGASLGVERAFGRPIDIAVNHDRAAIAMHAANHPNTRHLCEDVFEVDPAAVCNGRPVEFLWASPDCTHHSRAKGGKPRSKRIRGLAWVVVRWAATVAPAVICLENVPEFESWGPLCGVSSMPIYERRGETFREFVGQLEGLGYRVEWRSLVAADYGAPTTRKRLFLVARRDGRPIVWPEPTHGEGRQRPWAPAADCIDWSIPVRSIFNRPRPLADATMRRIAEGLRRFVLDNAAPFLIRTDMQSGGRLRGLAPLVDDPMRTVTATGSQGGLVAAFLAKHYGGPRGHRLGSHLNAPLGTVTAVDHHSLVAAFLTQYNGQSVGQDLRMPLGTVTSKDRFGIVTVTIGGEIYAICDIGMRMLAPRELARGQGLPDEYQLTGTQTSQIARIGNSVCPPVAEAVARAQITAPTTTRRAARPVQMPVFRGDIGEAA